jgi:hypothetical protein
MILIGYLLLKAVLGNRTFAISGCRTFSTRSESDFYKLYWLIKCIWKGLSLQLEFGRKWCSWKEQHRRRTIDGFTFSCNVFDFSWSSIKPSCVNKIGRKCLKYVETGGWYSLRGSSVRYTLKTHSNLPLTLWTTTDWTCLALRNIDKVHI